MADAIASLDGLHGEEGEEEGEDRENLRASLRLEEEEPIEPYAVLDRAPWPPGEQIFK